VMHFAGLTQIQAAARRSRQPEVFRLYSGSDLGIKEAGERRLERAGGDGAAGADPLLQASNGGAEMTQDGVTQTLKTASPVQTF